jgi:hypothetical protein
MSGEDWSDHENDAVVAAWFSMLTDELAGQTYNKAARNRVLQEQLGRSRGSIEFKLCNVSAVARGFGLPIVEGYKPRFNFQTALAEAVSRWLVRHPDWQAFGSKLTAMAWAERPALFVGVAPTLRNSPPPTEAEQLEAIARRFDTAGRDERNRALGRAGEELVLRHEREKLDRRGRHDLARSVRWVSEEDGDGAGYDISSFTPEGRPRLVEVKTTTGWERTPFYISRNELEVSDRHTRDWRLLRVFDFAREPRAFELVPPLAAHVSLIATSYEARFQ